MPSLQIALPLVEIGTSTIRTYGSGFCSKIDPSANRVRSQALRNGCFASRFFRSANQDQEFLMRSKLSISAAIVFGMLATMAYAQVAPEKQPQVESAQAAKAKAPHRERTIMRPSTTTGMSRGTPGARHNFYKESGS
jgi:hypothetical protein